MKMKRIISLAMALLLVCGMPVSAFAEYIPENPDGATINISPVQTLGTNKGTVPNNTGTVEVNGGTVIINFGTVETNENGGKVTINGAVGNNDKAIVNTNKGTVTNNYGTVSTNSGILIQNYGTVVDNNRNVATNYSIVENNNNGAHVSENKETVKHNDGNVDTNQSTGIVNENNGNVGYNYGTVSNNSSTGEVNFNYGTVDINDGTVKRNLFGTVKINNSTVKGNGGTVETNNGTVNDNKGTVNTNSITGTVTNYSGKVGTNYGTVNEADGSTHYGVQIDNDGAVALEQKEAGGILDLSKLFTKAGYELTGYTQAYQSGENGLTQSSVDVEGTDYSADCPNILTLIWRAIAGKSESAGYFGPGCYISVNGRQYILVEIKDGDYYLASCNEYTKEQLSDPDALLASLLTEEQLDCVTGKAGILNAEQAELFFGGGSHIVFPCSKYLIFH